MKQQNLETIQSARTERAHARGLRVSEQFKDGSITFTGSDNQQSYFLAYIGRRRRATAFYRFSTLQSRDEYAVQWHGDRRAALDAKKVRRAEQRQPHSLKRGDVLRASWGYDQTNIDFYEVIAVRGCVVDMQELKKDRTEDAHGMCGTCTPRRGDYCGQKMTGKRPNASNQVRVASYAYASPWDGRAQSWSSYA